MAPPAISVEVIPSRTELRLSESLRAEVRISGPAPLRLDLPKEWLAESSPAVWKIEPLGSPRLTDAPGGVQQWSQSFRLDPYLPGASVPLAFSPAIVNGQEVHFPSFSIAVTTSITNPKVEDARPITGIETLPPEPARPQLSGEPWQYAVVTLFLAIMVYRLFRRQKPKLQPEPSPSEWFHRELAKLNAGDANFAEAMAAIIRGYLRREHGIPAEARTVAELRATQPQLESMLSILDRCDRSKFAGEKLSGEECEEMRDRAVSFSRDAQRSDLERSPSGRG